MRTRQFDNAIADFTRTVELQPKYVEAYHQRGHAHENQGQLQRALDDYGAALQLQNKAAHLYVDRGRVHSRLGMPERARADYTQAVRLQPNHALAHNSLAWLLATCPDPKLRDPAQALRLAHRAVELAPKSGLYWKTLGAAQYRAGDWKAALAALEKSMALRNGGDSSDWFFLAMAHWQMGDQEQARKRYDQAVQWMDKNQPKNEELRRFRTEAAELLGIKEPPQ